VIAWEPVPHFRALLSYNLAVNKLTQLVTVRATVVAEPGSKQVCMQQRSMSLLHNPTLHSNTPHVAVPATPRGDTPKCADADRPTAATTRIAVVYV
jgi:hypothetical protein